MEEISQDKPLERRKEGRPPACSAYAQAMRAGRIAPPLSNDNTLSILTSWSMELDKTGEKRTPSGAMAKGCELGCLKGACDLRSQAMRTSVQFVQVIDNLYVGGIVSLCI